MTSQESGGSATSDSGSATLRQKWEVEVLGLELEDASYDLYLQF